MDQSFRLIKMMSCKKSIYYRSKLLAVFLAGSFSFTQSLAQSNADAVNQTGSVEKKKTVFTIGALYCNNANYYGQVADEKTPYIALSGSVRMPFGLYFTGLAYKLLNDSNTVSASALGAGYEFNITPKLTGDIGYNHTFYPSNSPFLQASNPDILSAALNYQHIFTTGLTFDYAFGKETSDYFLTLSNSRAFDFYTKDQKAIFSITPQVDITAGTQKFYSSYREKRNNKGRPANPGQPAIITMEQTNFGVLSYNFKVPVSYSRASYMLEAAYQLSVLGNNVASGTGSAHSFVTLSAYYQF